MRAKAPGSGTRAFSTSVTASSARPRSERLDRRLAGGDRGERDAQPVELVGLRRDRAAVGEVGDEEAEGGEHHQPRPPPTAAPRQIQTRRSSALGSRVARPASGKTTSVRSRRRKKLRRSTAARARGCGAAGRPKAEASAADQPVDRRALLGGRGQVEAAQPGARLVAALAEDGVDERLQRRLEARDLGGEAEDLGAGGELLLALHARRRPGPRGGATSAAELAARPRLPSARSPGAKVAPQTCSRSAVASPSKLGSKPLIRSALVISR